MATVDKNFKVKHGLIVEGNTATVNGEDILTTGSTVTTDFVTEGANLYFTAERAANAVADEISGAVNTAINALTTDVIEEGEDNLYFTDTRAQSAVASDIATAKSEAISAAQTYTNNAITSATDGLATESYVNSQGFLVSSDLSTYATQTYAANVASQAETAANGYTDTAISGLSTVYDAIGAAAGAETAANLYTDTALEDYTPTSGLDAAVGGYGYLKSADLSGYATETYVGTAVSNAVDGLVDGAPGLLDTLNEIAAAIADDENYATTMTTALAGKQDELTAGTGITISGDTISVTANTYASVTAPAVAEQNAKDYADQTFVTLADLPGQLDDYVPTSEKGQALGVATLDEDGYVPASQLNIADAYITAIASTDSNLDVTDGELSLTTTPSFTEVKFGNVAKQIAATTVALTPSTVTAYSFSSGVHRSGEFLVKIATQDNTEISKILLTLDNLDNISITEYGVVATDTSLGSISADMSGVNVRIRITTSQNDSVITVAGTLVE